MIFCRRIYNMLYLPYLCLGSAQIGKEKKFFVCGGVCLIYLSAVNCTHCNFY